MAAKKAATRKRKFAGVLARPMKPGVDPERARSLVPLSNAERNEGFAKERLQHFERTLALLEHYQLKLDDPNAGWKLAWALARDYVPGFKIEGQDGSKKRGAGNKWDNRSRAFLWFAVKGLMELGDTRERACELIFGAPEFRRHLPATITSAGSLSRQYEKINSALPAYVAVLERLRVAGGAKYADMLDGWFIEEPSGGP